MSIDRVDQELCNGCGICITTCPLDVIRLDTEVKDKNEHPACRLACPAGVDMRVYMNLLKDGMVKEAMDVVREALPLPAVTGRVCPHPCENECSRKEVDEAVNINALERFVADSWLKEKPKPVDKIFTHKTAVIGSGPAGLSCAHFLARMGYPVTIFEAMPVLGGILRAGIPAYRLSREVLDAQINYILGLGVDFKTGVTIGKDITIEALRKEFGAIFYAGGNQLSREIKIKGVGLKGVKWGLDYLKEVNLGGEAAIKGRVVVIGGGNVAMDVALTALRGGAKEVQIACLEKGGDMPAFKEEISQAIEEGIVIHEGWGPQEIVGKGGQVSGVKLVRCTGVYDKAGKFSPCYDENETRIINTDNSILAIGQAVDLSLIPAGMKLTRAETIQVDPVTLETTLPGVFAGGDIVSGPSSVVEAIAAGKRASVSIDRYLKGEDMEKGRYLRPKAVPYPPKEGIEKLDRCPTKLLPVNQRKGNFKEVKIVFDEDTANLESRRCMTCGSRAVISYVDECQLCVYCEMDCPRKAIWVAPEKKANPLMAWA